MMQSTAWNTREWGSAYNLRVQPAKYFAYGAYFWRKLLQALVFSF